MTLTKYKNYLQPELHGMLNDIQQATGSKVDKLPPLNSTPENARFLVKQSDGTYKEHIKLNGNYQELGGSGNGTNGKDGKDGKNGVDGDSAFVYIAYANDAAGTGFTMTFDSTLDYLAIKETTTEIISPTASDFTGLWKKIKGDAGESFLNIDGGTPDSNYGGVTPINGGTP